MSAGIIQRNRQNISRPDPPLFLHAGLPVELVHRYQSASATFEMSTLIPSLASVAAGQVTVCSQIQRPLELEAAPLCL